MFITTIVLTATILVGFIRQEGISQPSTSTQVSTTLTSTTSSSIKLSIYDVIPRGFHIVDEIVYLRFEIIGDVDLRESIEINGIYGYWQGVVTVVVPNGVEPWIFIPPDYSTGRNIFDHIEESVEYDVPVYDLLGGSPSVTHPQSPLNGTYKITVWLSGPYDEKVGGYPKVVLIEKSFNYTFKVSIGLHSLEWSSWDQEVAISITNGGDVPVFFRGAGILIHGVNTVIGWLSIQSNYICININESKDIVAKLTILDDYKPIYEGKVEPVDILFEFLTIPPINETFPVKFPAE